MGRIEDALAKLQARQVSADAGAKPQPTLGKVSPQPSTVASLPSHEYGGKRIEIDLAMLLAQGLLAPDSQERALADEYRTIKRPLLRNSRRDHDPAVPRGNVWIVASALPGEGKTFTCINLCLSVAREEDWSVVLVDGDCNKPHLTRLFGADHEPGLMDLLRDSALQPDGLIMPTNIPGLSILPAGKHDERAAELLGSARMDALCEEWAHSDRRRIVLFDSPPLLLTSEAPVLASQVGQIIVVVHANRTPQQAVLAAVDKLDQSKAVNLLLNQTMRHETSSYGDYYPAYGSAD